MVPKFDFDKLDQLATQMRERFIAEREKLEKKAYFDQHKEKLEEKKESNKKEEAKQSLFCVCVCMSNTQNIPNYKNTPKTNTKYK